MTKPARFCLMYGGPEVSRHNTKAAAFAAGEKRVRNPNQSVVVQDTAPEGRPGKRVCTVWRLVNGVWIDSVFSTIPKKS